MIEPFQSDDAFLANVESTPADAARLDVWWLGQSGYLVRHAAARVVFDPYLSDALTRKYERTDKPHVRMSRRVVDPSRLSNVTHVTSTHGHTDHLDGETLNPIFAANPTATFVYARSTQSLVDARVTRRPVTLVPLNAGDRHDDAHASFAAVLAAHQPPGRDDVGDAHCVGLVVRLGRFRIYHAGDGVPYDGLAESVAAFGPIDLAIVPINGKVGNMDGVAAARLARAIGARVAMPCHYDLFAFNTADPNDRFVPECARIGQACRVLRLGERMTLEGIR